MWHYSDLESDLGEIPQRRRQPTFPPPPPPPSPPPPPATLQFPPLQPSIIQVTSPPPSLTPPTYRPSRPMKYQPRYAAQAVQDGVSGRPEIRITYGGRRKRDQRGGRRHRRRFQNYEGSSDDGSSYSPNLRRHHHGGVVIPLPTRRRAGSSNSSDGGHMESEKATDVDWAHDAIYDVDMDEDTLPKSKPLSEWTQSKARLDDPVSSQLPKLRTRKRPAASQRPAPIVSKEKRSQDDAEGSPMRGSHDIASGTTTELIVVHSIEHRIYRSGHARIVLIPSPQQIRSNTAKNANQEAPRPLFRWL
jgi:hypothetical protein